MSSSLTRGIVLAALAGGLLGACDDPNVLADATVPNAIDTVSLYAYEGTPVNTPSGYSIIDARAVRIDQRPDFDFAFNLGPGDVPWLLPPAALGVAQNLTLQPGMLEPAADFDDLTIAQLNGYRWADTLAVSVGQTWVARSRIACSIGVPLYAKLRILSVDPAARTLTFEVLANRNCGYRGLQPGLPDS